MSELSEALKGFDSLILVKVKINEDVCESDFIYQSGSFDMIGLKKMNSFREVIKSIYRSSSICEGIGYYEYCKQIKQSIHLCALEGKRVSYLLPLRKNGKNGATHHVLMNVNKDEEYLNVIFVCFDEQ